MAKRKWLLLILLVLLFAMPGITILQANDQSQSIVERPLRIINPRLSALGGAHPALTDSFGTYFNNPAGFFAAGPEFSIFEITMGVRGPIFSIADAFLGGDASADGDDNGDDDIPLETIAEILDGLNAGLDLLTPLAFGYAGKGLGLGIHSSSAVNLKGVSLGLEGSVHEDIILSGGYAFRFFPAGNHNLDAGLLLKGFFRGLLELNVSALDLEDAMDLDYYKTEPFYLISGIGLDAGIRYSYKNRFVAAVSANDLYTPTLRYPYGSLDNFLEGGSAGDAVQGTVPIRINGGILYNIDYLPVSFFISEIKLMFSYFNMFDFILTPERSRNTLLNLGAGIEITMLEILDIRAGFRDGLFAAGLGLDLHYFALNGVMFGSELSTEPGLNPVYNLQLGIEMRF